MVFRFGMKYNRSNATRNRNRSAAWLAWGKLITTIRTSLGGTLIKFDDCPIFPLSIFICSEPNWKSDRKVGRTIRAVQQSMKQSAINWSIETHFSHRKWIQLDESIGSHAGLEINIGRHRRGREEKCIRSQKNPAPETTKEWIIIDYRQRGSNAHKTILSPSSSNPKTTTTTKNSKS